MYQKVHNVRLMCRVLAVSPAGYYAWRRRGLSVRAQTDAALLQQIQAIWRAHRSMYGAYKTWKALLANNICVGRHHVARLMREHNMVGICRKRQRSKSAKPESAPAMDLVNRDFTATAPNKLWVADITYVPTAMGFLYLAVVLDVFSRRIVGWSMRSHLRATLVEEALQMAFATRRPSEVIHHSDRGSQYTSLAFGKRCRDLRVRTSMGSVGDCYDNAMCESFFANLEFELLARHRFDTHADARVHLFEYIEGFYNPRRLHSALDYQSPLSYERNFQSAA
jgi:putative transposase